MSSTVICGISAITDAFMYARAKNGAATADIITNSDSDVISNTE